LWVCSWKFNPTNGYKAKGLYERCTKNSPAGAIYHATTESEHWFDGRPFTQRFDECFLTVAKEISRTKLMIGDNLASYFTPEVVSLALNNNIYFQVCLQILPTLCNL